MYTTPLSYIISQHNVSYHKFADDTRLYCEFNSNLPEDVDRAKKELVGCAQDIKAWMLTNGLKLNENKTEFIIFISNHHQIHVLLVGENIILGDSVITASSSVRNLGAYFDNHMSMSRHVERGGLVV